MEKRLDRTDKKAGRTVQESRKKSFTETRYKTQGKSSERQQTGNMSEAAQVSTSSSSDRHIKPDASGSRDRILGLRQQQRNDSRVASNPSDSPSYWQYRQSNEVRPDRDMLLGQRKGMNREESSSQQKDLTIGQEITPEYLNKLADEAKSLRLQHEIFQIREKVRDNSTPMNEMFQLLERSKEIAKEKKSLGN